MNFKPLDHIPTGRNREGDKYIDDQYRYHEFRNGEWVTLNLIDLVATVERLNQAVKVLGGWVDIPDDGLWVKTGALIGEVQQKFTASQLRDLFGLE